MIGRDDDHTLVAASRAGQTEAFGLLVRRYQDRLFPTVLRLTGSVEDAYDLLQDAFLRAYQKLDRFHGESSFYTWIYRIAVNLALSDRRKRRGPVATGREETFEPAANLDDSDPSLQLMRAELDESIQDALNRLHPDHRAVVVMKDLDGLRYEQIASILRVPVGTVRSRLHRARGELRHLLRPVVEGEVARVGPRTVS